MPSTSVSVATTVAAAPTTAEEKNIYVNKTHFELEHHGEM